MSIHKEVISSGISFCVKENTHKRRIRGRNEKESRVRKEDKKERSQDNRKRKKEIKCLLRIQNCFRPIR